MFNLGDKVVYPMHGAGVIETLESKEILGEVKSYYVLKMPIGEMKLMIPVDNVNNIGLRNIIDKSLVEGVYSILKQAAVLNDSNWNKRFRDNMIKMKTGDIFEVAQVVRDLTYRDKEKGLSTGEKKMLVSAKQMLVSEISLSTETDSNGIQEYLDNIINEDALNV
ncbi:MULTISPECIES: CarD family transcriptional regulator [Sedimentibacter]|jgi:CarD family transcriptional regulator|uniref:CarD family transcriptional regulator n=1 Tax=Sedimentibacter saalensis TaxID=130788 RepID=A0A562JCC1_9FIRM|nr:MULTISPECIES: CarD family transcriptional regulator [Sedimentibacter]MEA5094089.1 CarD family transcriptional regulator [Sedimentibacter saalensis]TWH80475.1 CarD family transcriptional regulator [Sedimentibacter saalensis]